MNYVVLADEIKCIKVAQYVTEVCIRSVPMDTSFCGHMREHKGPVMSTHPSVEPWLECKRCLRAH